MQAHALALDAGTVLAAALLAGCATVQTPTKGDPLEGFNRTIFTFNDTIDQYALKPVAQGLRVRHAAAGARQRHELLLEHRRRLHRGEQPAAAEDRRWRVETSCAS